MRQINRYYRDLEAWQYQEKQYLKRYGMYNRENIEQNLKKVNVILDSLDSLDA